MEILTGISATSLEQKRARHGVWGLGFTAAIYSAASSDAVHGSRPVSVGSPGCYCVSCHYRGMQVSFATRTVHVLLCLDLDDRILWYNAIKVYMGRLGEPLYLKLYVAMHVCLCMHLSVFTVTETICPVVSAHV